MEFLKLVDLVRAQFAHADASIVPGKLAVQFDITGEGGGTFYAEVKDGILSIEPYSYDDRDVRLIVGQEDFLKMLNQQLDPVAAFTFGKLKVDGDIGKALEITRFIKGA